MLGQRIAQMGRDITYTYKLQNLDESLCTRGVGWVGKGRCTWNLGWRRRWPVMTVTLVTTASSGHMYSCVFFYFFICDRFTYTLPWSPLPLHSARIAFALESFNLYYEEHKFWWPLTIAYLLTCTANCNFLLLDLQSFAFTWKILHFLSTEVLDLAAFAMMLRPN